MGARHSSEYLASDRYKESRQRTRRKYKNNDKKIRLAKGMCMHCTNPRLPDSKTLCLKHWFIKTAHTSMGLGKVTDGAKLKAIMEKQNWTCPYTGTKLIPGKNTWLDHKNPVSRFPAQKNDFDNVEWTLSGINYMKRNLTKEEFLDLCRDISRRGSDGSTTRLLLEDVGVTKTSLAGRHTGFKSKKTLRGAMCLLQAAKS